MRIEQSHFGRTPRGHRVTRFTLHNDRGVGVSVIDLGAIVQSVMVPDREGVLGDIVLGYDDAGLYWHDTDYMGAVIGRFANRIARGRFTLDGTAYRLSRNHGAHHLHGGRRGFDKRLWAAEAVPGTNGIDLVLQRVSGHGEEGYPGNLSVSVTYSLNNANELRIRYRAETDQATPVNLTHHGYFNLTGRPQTAIGEHTVWINADFFLPVDADGIPTGAIAPVAGTPLDFRQPTPIRERIDGGHGQLGRAGGYDHNWILNAWDGALKRQAAVCDQTSGRLLEVFTSEPGLQFYTGNSLHSRFCGKGHHPYRCRQGLCLETQHFPDSPNQPHFPSTILRPGEIYRSETVYRFRLQPDQPSSSIVGAKMENRNVADGKRIFKQVPHALTKAGYTPDSQLLSSLIHSLPLNVFAKDRDGRFIFANDFYCKRIGKTYEELIGKNDFEIHPRELAEKFRADDKRIMDLCQAESIEEAWQSLGGDYGYIQVLKSPLFDHHQQVIGIIGIFWDITDRKKTEIALAEERSLLRTIIDIVPGYIYVKDRESRFLVANKAVARLMGANDPGDVIGKTDFDFYSESDAEHFRHDELQVMQAGKPLVDLEESFYSPDGQLGWILTNKVPLRNIEGAVVGFVGMGLNITKRKEAERARKKLEAQLLQAQKMETVGTLAGGLAHDLNNLLMGIQGHASLMTTEMDETHPFRPNIAAIEEYVQSATALTNQLLGFARGGKYETKPTAFNDMVDQAAEMFSRTHKEIRIRKSFASGLWVVEADRRQMEQVFLNLFINAWQAMPGGGDLFLSTENVTLDETVAAVHTVAPGRFIKISVTDTGMGMDESTRRRIFDPFFTTKGIGRGTGLGLASAYGIVKNHGGLITVYSEPGHGTAFNIFLPASDKDAQEEVVIDKKIFKGSGTILVVDDEEMILNVAKAILERLGYRAIVAAGGQKAVEVVRERGDEIDLVVLDLIMPGFDGRKTFEGIREIRPDLPVMLSSGYSINGQATEILNRGANGFIQKPFQIAELSQAIRKILDETGYRAGSCAS